MNVEVENKKKKRCDNKEVVSKDRQKDRGSYAIRYSKFFTPCLVHESYVYPKEHTPIPACFVSFIFTVSTLLI